MKLQVTKENLNRALNAVARIASSRGTLPILANIALKTDKNRLCISATNLDIAISYTIGAKINQDGSTTIPARLTQDLITSLPTGIIDIKLLNNKLNISTGKYQSTINSISAEDFPTMPKINKGNSFEISTQLLKKSLAKIAGAASSDESRPVLTGVYMASDGNKLIIAATDSYRLAEIKLDQKIDLKQLIIPVNAINELLRVISTDDEGKITITYNDHQVCFTTNEIELTARLIDGTYPPYKNLIPNKFATSAVIEKDDLQNITKVSSLFAKESLGSITINIEEDGGQISIHSVANQLGENTASAKANISGDGSITLNSRYLLDALSVMGDSEDIFLGFNNKLEPIVLHDNKKKDFIYVIMPLKS